MVLLFLYVIFLAEAAWPREEPFWPHYPTRKLLVLDGIWEFGFSLNADPLRADPLSPTPSSVRVPHSFDVAAPGIPGQRGTAFYRTKFEVDPDKSLLINFAACSFYCRVFVDHVEIGEHRAGGYVPFWLESGPAKQRQREIFVIVNNDFNSTLAPTHTGGDFWHFGGITRHVIIHEKPQPSYLVRVETFTQEYNPGIIDANIVLGGASGKISVSLSWDRNPAGTPLQLPVTNGLAVLEKLQVPNSKPWSIKEPHLHTLTVNLLGPSNTTIVDAITVRFGLRKLGMTQYKSSTRVSINDQVVGLHGVNRHTMWPDTGSALTFDQVQKDIEVLKKLHVNYVRGAHYPQDQRFLDLCDENGIIIWEEALGPSVTTKDIKNPYFMKYHLESMEEMISASINHPCVVFHGFFNEGPSNDPQACSGYQASADVVKKRVGTTVPSRFVTWANDHLMSDVCLGFADVISFNSYPAWYNHPGDLNAIIPFWTSQVQQVKAKYPQKPFTISEAGAGGIYEWKNSSDVFWGQQFQSKVVETTAKFAVSEPHITGLTIWQFSDIKANDGDTKHCGQCEYKPHPPHLSVPWDCAYINTKCGRPGGENHKGQVDYWRREKETFHTLSQVYGTASRNL